MSTTPARDAGLPWSSPIHLPWPRLAVLGSVLLAFVLRVAYLDAQGLWADEFSSLDRASLPFGDLLSQLPVEHVPFYYWLLRAWTLVAGDTDFALRFPAVVAGVLAVALLYGLARRLVGPPVAALAAFLLALNPFQVWHSQEVRMYSVLAALGLAALWGLDVALTTPRRRWLGGGAYVAASLAAMYSHNYGVLIPVMGFVYALWHAVARRPGGGTRVLLASHAAIAVLAIPWLLRFLRIGEYDSPLSLLSADPLAYPAFYAFGVTLPDGLLAGLGLAIVALGGLGLVVLYRDGRATGDSSAFVLVVIAIGVPLALACALLAAHSVFHPRYFITAAPLYSLALARGVVALYRRAALVGALTAAFLVVGAAYSLRLWYTDPAYARALDKATMSLVLPHAGGDQALILDGPRVQFFKRYGSDSFDRTVNLRGRLRGQGVDAIVAEVAEVAAAHPVVWLILRPPGDTAVARQWLDAHGYRGTSQTIEEYTVLPYAFPTSQPQPAPPQTVTGAAPVDVVWSASPVSTDGDDAAAIEVAWTPRAALPANTQVSLRLADAAGRVVWQRDHTLGDGQVDAGETAVARAAVGLTEDLPPGVYTLQAILYAEPDQGEVWRATLGPVTLTE